jgi:hypothetical protein
MQIKKIRLKVIQMKHFHFPHHRYYYPIVKISHRLCPFCFVCCFQLPVYLTNRRVEEEGGVDGVEAVYVE